jgi:probable phosphoglycerate mutase
VIYVARHGETDWNRDGRYQGRQESSLTALGSAQSRALAGAFAQRAITRVISSPLARCVDTARPLAQALRLPVETDARLLEIAHGDWEGRLRGDIQREDPQTWHDWKNAPERVRFSGGESVDEVLERWRGFARELDGNDETVVVTHDVIVRLAIVDATGRGLAQLWEPRVVNAGYAVFVPGTPWRLVEECADAHLEGIGADPASQAL